MSGPPPSPPPQPAPPAPAAAATIKAWCSDCGQQAVGYFDVVKRPDGYAQALKAGKISSSDESQFDRPLCEKCSTRRPGTVPSPA